MKGFSFNVSLHKEDANPVLLANNNSVIMAVADGLGGAGRYKHTISDNVKEDYKLARIVYKDTKIDYYNDKYVQEAFNLQEGENATSAYLGSRVVLLRFYDYINKYGINADCIDNDYLEELSNYIAVGYTNISKALTLSNNGFSRDMRLMPSTFASLVYSHNSKALSYMWVGDSRCYMIDESGLSQLSKDDEDEAGAVTKIFCYDNNMPKISHRKVMLDKPAVFMTMSDGIFDLFETNFQFEYFLLKSILECDNFESLKVNFIKFFEEHKSDDCSMCFAFSGNSYDELKNMVCKRYKYIENLMEGYNQYKECFFAKNDPEYLAGIEEYLSNRIESRVDEISDLLLSTPDDILWQSKDLVGFYANLIQNNLSVQNIRDTQNIKIICSDKTQDWINRYNAFIGSIKNIIYLEQSMADLESRYYEIYKYFLKELQNTICDIQLAYGEENRYLEDLIMSENKFCEIKFHKSEKVKELFFKYYILSKVLQKITSGKFNDQKDLIRKLDKENADIFKEAISINDKLIKLKKSYEKRNIDSIKQDYQKMLLKILNDKNLISKCIIRYNGNIYLIKEEDKQELQKLLVDCYKELLQFRAMSKEQSVIDGMFNKIMYNDYINALTKLSYSDSQEYKQFEQDYKNCMIGYNRYIDA